MHKLFVAVALLLLPNFASLGQASDSTSKRIELTYEQAKAMLLRENLSIIAEHYNIDISEAEVRQAKVWNNPYFVWNADMYSVEKNNYFAFRNQKLIQIEQVFSVSGKHTNAVKLAKVNAKMDELSYLEVVRGLVYEFNNTFTNVTSLIEKKTLYDEVLKNYQRLLLSYEKQLSLGMISYNELLRLRSEQTSIMAEAINNKNELSENLSSLKSMLNLAPTTDLVLLVNKNSIETDSIVVVSELINLALENRPDYKLTEKAIEYSKTNYKLQKSLAMPDMKLAYQPHDKGSNYVRPYSGMVFEMSLPFFNRNQGNISIAKIQMEQTDVKLKQKGIEIENEIVANYQQLQNNKKGLENYSSDFLKNVADLHVYATDNFDKKNISFLQYIDFQRNYINTQVQYLDLLKSYNISKNKLNFSIGIEKIR